MAEISIRGGGALDVSKVVTTTGANGRFSIRSASELSTVSARAKGWASSEAHMVAGEVGFQVEMRIILSAAGGRIHGQVLDPDGHPRFSSEERELFANEVWDLGIIRIPAGGSLHARLYYPADGPQPSPSVRVQTVDGGDVYSTHRASDSHTQVLVPGSYRLVVMGTGVAYQSIPFEIQAGETTELEIEIETGLRRDFGLELPRAAQEEQQIAMTITSDGGIVLRETVHQSQSGKFETDAMLAPGDYTITAQTTGGRSGSSQFTVEAGQETVPGIRVRLR